MNKHYKIRTTCDIKNITQNILNKIDYFRLAYKLTGWKTMLNIYHLPKGSPKDLVQTWQIATDPKYTSLLAGMDEQDTLERIFDS